MPSNHVPIIPSDRVLFLIDTCLEYLPISGKLIWTKRTARWDRTGQDFGYLTSEGYRRGKVGKKVLQAHHIAWYKFYGEWPTNEIDHNNHIRNDNSIRNINVVGRYQNRWNHCDLVKSKTGIKGIYINASGTIRVFIQRNHIKVNKTFASIQEAIVYRDMYAGKIAQAYRTSINEGYNT